MARNFFQESLFRCGRMIPITGEVQSAIVKEAYVVDMYSEQLSLPFEKEAHDAEQQEKEEDLLSP